MAGDARIASSVDKKHKDSVSSYLGVRVESDDGYDDDFCEENSPSNTVKGYERYDNDFCEENSPSNNVKSKRVAEENDDDEDYGEDDFCSERGDEAELDDRASIRGGENSFSPKAFSSEHPYADEAAVELARNIAISAVRRITLTSTQSEVPQIHDIDHTSPKVGAYVSSASSTSPARRTSMLMEAQGHRISLIAPDLQLLRSDTEEEKRSKEAQRIIAAKEAEQRKQEAHIVVSDTVKTLSEQMAAELGLRLTEGAIGNADLRLTTEARKDDMATWTDYEEDDTEFAFYAGRLVEVPKSQRARRESVVSVARCVTPPQQSESSVSKNVSEACLVQLRQTVAGAFQDATLNGELEGAVNTVRASVQKDNLVPPQANTSDDVLAMPPCAPNEQGREIDFDLIDPMLEPPQAEELAPPEEEELAPSEKDDTADDDDDLPAPAEHAMKTEATGQGADQAKPTRHEKSLMSKKSISRLPDFSAELDQDLPGWRDKYQVGDETLLTVRVGKNKAIVTADAGVNVNLVFDARPFKDWVRSMAKQTRIDVSKIHIQSVDMFGRNMGFIKVKVDAKIDGKKIPGIVFMRGGTVAVLVILQHEGKRFTLVVRQPRVPVCSSSLAEIPVGLLDEDGNFAGVAAKELKEEAGIQIGEGDLIDMSHLAFKRVYPGMLSSCGACDEYCRMFLYRKTISAQELEKLNGKLTGVFQEGEMTKLQLIPLEALWRTSADAKALVALCLHDKLESAGLISKVSPQSIAQENWVAQMAPCAPDEEGVSLERDAVDFDPIDLPWQAEELSPPEEGEEAPPEHEEVNEDELNEMMSAPGEHAYEPPRPDIKGTVNEKVEEPHRSGIEEVAITFVDNVVDAASYTHIFSDNRLDVTSLASEMLSAVDAPSAEEHIVQVESRTNIAEDKDNDEWESVEMEEDETRVQNIRADICKGLLAGFRNGALSTAIEETVVLDGIGRKSSVVNTAEFREQVQRLLIDAALDGRLEKSFQSIQANVAEQLPPSAPEEEGMYMDRDFVDPMLEPEELAPPEEVEEAPSEIGEFAEHRPEDDDVVMAPTEHVNNRPAPSASTVRHMFSSDSFGDARIQYPGLDDLLNDPDFRCREEWRRKIAPMQQDPDEPLYRQPLSPGRVHAPAQPSKMGKRPRRQPAPSAQAPSDSEAPRPPMGHRTLRPIPPPTQRSAPISHSLSPRQNHTLSQRAEDFKRIYLQEPVLPPKRPPNHRKDIAKRPVVAMVSKVAPERKSSLGASNRGSSLPPLPAKIDNTMLLHWCDVSYQNMIDR